MKFRLIAAVCACEDNFLWQQTKFECMHIAIKAACSAVYRPEFCRKQLQSERYMQLVVFLTILLEYMYIQLP